MSRLRRFITNAGLKGCLLTLAVMVATVFAVRKDVQTGLWMYTVATLLVAVGVAYLLRDALVYHVGVTRLLMNFVGTLAIITVAVGRRWLPGEAPWLRLTTAAFLGAYMGCYFWLMSDERIVVER